MNRVNLADKLALFSDHWSPKIVGELNGQHVKLVKVAGEFEWHQHEHEDEPASTLNTGNVRSARTLAELERI